MKLCRRCNGELIHDEKRDCLVCPTCYSPNRAIPKPEKKVIKLVDVRPTEERVAEMIAEQLTQERIRNIVIDELENWHIQKPTLTVEKIKAITDTLTPKTGDILIPVNPELAANLDWRAHAKELGIPLFQRKKKDVLADIEKAVA